MLAGLMGRIPARCILLLEDLDASFTRSTTRDGKSTGVPTVKTESDSKENKDGNTLSLSGLLNAYVSNLALARISLLTHIRVGLMVLPHQKVACSSLLRITLRGSILLSRGLGVWTSGSTSRMQLVGRLRASSSASSLA